jgi:hypothetical protein
MDSCRLIWIRIVSTCLTKRLTIDNEPHSQIRRLGPLLVRRGVLELSRCVRSFDRRGPARVFPNAAEPIYAGFFSIPQADVWSHQSLPVDVFVPWERNRRVTSPIDSRSRPTHSKTCRTIVACSSLISVIVSCDQSFEDLANWVAVEVG